MPDPLPPRLAYRVVDRVNGPGNVIVGNLAHPHKSRWTVASSQPGLLGSTGIGEFSIPLFSPLSEEGRKAWNDYSKMFNAGSNSRGLRVEGYLGDVITGTPRVAGFIRALKRGYGGWEITGSSDVWLASKQRTWTGELQFYTQARDTLRQFMGVNEMGFGDDYNVAFTSGNYTSGATPPGTATATWAAATDDGLNVVQATGATATNAVLLANATFDVSGDPIHHHYAETTVRIQPTTDASQAGEVGIAVGNVIGASGTGMYVKARLKWVAASSTWSVDAFDQQFNAGTLTQTDSATNVLTGLASASGLVTLTIGVIIANPGNATMLINGKVVLTTTNSTFGPIVSEQVGLHFSQATTGTATAFFRYLYAEKRYVVGAGASPKTDATFIAGTQDNPSNFLDFYQNAPQTFLDGWQASSALGGRTWRYTPQAMVVGKRTIGSLDWTVSPGSDLSASVVFQEGGNLEDLQQQEAADAWATGLMLATQANTTSGGLAPGRNIAAVNATGVVTDVVWNPMPADHSVAWKAATQLIAAKIDANQSWTAVVVRTAETADKWRELDTVLVDSPLAGVNRQKFQVLGYDLDETTDKQQVTLARWQIDRPLVAARLAGILNLLSQTYQSR